jgi:Na+/melibiose symporter-like transporter
MSLITLGSFLSAAVYETDKSLVLFYIEEHLNVDDADIAQMFFFMGILGVLMQALGLQPLINLMGERGLLVVSFLSGTLHNFLYGAAKNKTVITVAISLSQLTKLNYPILSSMASQGVCTDEQGQVQGKSMHLVLDKRVLCIEKTILIYFHPLI